MSTPESYAEKIAKLLEQANSNGASQAEADTFFAKAQELMTKYSISQQMIDQHANKVREEILAMPIKYRGIFRKTFMMMGHYLSIRNNCKAIMFGESRDDTSVYVELQVNGFESDVNNVIMLDTSLQLQASTALARWWREYDRKTYLSNMAKYKERRQFLEAFGQAVSERLAEAIRRGEREAALEHAAAAHLTEDDAIQGVALVVRDRKDQVNDWVDKKYGRLRSSRSRHQSGSGSAHAAGGEAGRRADLGGGKLGGSRGQLNA